MTASEIPHRREARRKTRSPQRTITLHELNRLAWCNSKKLPQTVNIGGVRHQWVGIGWVAEGDPDGTEIVVVEDDAVRA